MRNRPVKGKASENFFNHAGAGWCINFKNFARCRINHQTFEGLARLGATDNIGIKGKLANYTLGNLGRPDQIKAQDRDVPKASRLLPRLLGEPRGTDRALSPLASHVPPPHAGLRGGGGYVREGHAQGARADAR